MKIVLNLSFQIKRIKRIYGKKH